MSPGLPITPMGVRPMALFLRSASALNALEVISVAIKPGAMQLMRIPWGDSSVAMARVMPSIAVLEAEYAITLGIPYCAAMELMLTMLPFLLGNMVFTTSRVNANTATKLV